MPEASQQAKKATITVGPDFAGARTPVGTLVRFSTRKTTFQGRVMELRERTARVGAGPGGRWRVPYERLEVVSPAPGQKRTLEEADKLIQSLMARHLATGGLPPGWRARFDLAAVRAGVCKYLEQLICLPVSYAMTADRHELVDTVLHEIAHAIVGPGHNHDATWKRTAQRIGCTAERCTEVIHTAPAWIGTCNCRKPTYRKRLSRVARAGRCIECRAPYKWRRNTTGEGAGET